jgi:hypothetical protein
VGKTEALPRRYAIIFIVFLGVVSLFGDMTYEGARSIVGPYLGLLSVTATTLKEPLRSFGKSLWRMTDPPARRRPFAPLLIWRSNAAPSSI